MNAIDTLRMFCDGRMSLHDIRALMESIGHSREDFTIALGVLLDEPGTEWRFNKYQSGEMHAEMFLTSA